MNPDPEISVLAAVDTALSSLPDADARRRVLRWAIERHLPRGEFALGELVPHDAKPRKTVLLAAPLQKQKTAAPKGKKFSPSIVKDVNLKPASKRGFSDFVSEKKPESQFERCVVAAYYLEKILAIPAVSVDHIYTCFKAYGWRLPADIVNTLQLAASRGGYLDTKNRQAIRVTTMGENLVEHDLPRDKGKK